MFHFERQSYLGMIKKTVTNQSPTSHQPWFQTASPQFPYLGLQSPKRRHNGHNGTVSLEALIYVDYPLVMTNIAMENGQFIDDFPS